MTPKALFRTLAAAALTLCAACSYNPNDYSCFSNINPDEGWKYGLTMIYMPEIADSITTGQLAVMVRHTNDYPFSNLWVELESQQNADGHITFRRDTFCIELADPYGNWYGTGLGTSFQKVDTVYADFELTNAAPLRLRHVMRPEHVKGIEQVGLIFNAKRP